MISSFVETLKRSFGAIPHALDLLDGWVDGWTEGALGDDGGSRWSRGRGWRGEVGIEGEMDGECASGGVEIGES